MGRVDIGMGCMLHWQVVTWAGQWRQVAEEEVHLCRAVCIWATHFVLLLSAAGEGSMAVEHSVLRMP